MENSLLGLPGVKSVNWSNAAPLDQELSAMAVEIRDHPKPPGAPAYVLWNASATAGYFHALGVPSIVGRNFTDADRQGTSPVMIISAGDALTESFPDD